MVALPMTLLITVLFLVLVGLSYLAKKYNNPYKLTFIFGKKGAGKSCYMVHEMLRYMKRGYHVYTDMADCRIPGVRIISVDMLSSFRPEPNSALFLDEVGISMDNRNFKSFPPGLRDFFKYLRKMKCVCYLNSQAFDVDKKVRDTTDKMVLQVALLGCFSLSRPIIRSITLTESTSQADSRIADNLRFSTIWKWRIFYMPRYFKYFDTSSMPDRPLLPIRYSDHADPDLSPKSIKEMLLDVFSKARQYFGREPL